MQKIHVLALLIALLSPTFVACSKDSEAGKDMAAAAQDAKSAANKAGESMKAEFAVMQQEYSQDIEPKLAELDKKLGDLKAKAATLTGDAKMKLDKSINDLTARRGDLEKLWNDMKTQTESGWKSFTDKVSSTVSDLQKSVDSALKSK